MDTQSFFIIVSYLLLVSLFGTLFTKRLTSSREWTIAQSSMGVLLIAVGVAGTRIGGGGTYGVAGHVITGGVWYAWWYAISTFLALALVGFFFAVPYRRLRLQTVGEIFAQRFASQRCQAMTSLCVQTEYLIVNIIEAYVIGIILSGVTGWSMGLTVVLAEVIMISYVIFGGLRGAAVTNFVHCTVIIIGFVMIALLGVEQFGGWHNLTERVDYHLEAADYEPTKWWAFAGGGTGLIIGMIFSAVIHTPAASVYTNYASSARDEKILVRAFMFGGLIAASMPLLAGVIGIETFAAYGLERGFGSYQNVTNLARDIHPIIGSVALAAILAAVVSSGGPILLSSATMLVRDWLWFASKNDDKKQLRDYRIVTILYAGFGGGLAWLWSQYDIGVGLLDAVLFAFAMVVPPALAVAFVIYWRQTSESGAFWGMTAGWSAGLLWFVTGEFAQADLIRLDVTNGLLGQFFEYCFPKDGNGIDTSYATTLIPLAVIPVVSIFTTVNREREEKFLELLGKKL